MHHSFVVEFWCVNICIMYRLYVKICSIYGKILALSGHEALANMGCNGAGRRLERLEKDEG